MASLVQSAHTQSRPSDPGQHNVGPGNAVAMSGTCDERTADPFGWVGMPGFGAVVLDEDDIGQSESDGVFEAVTEPVAPGTA